ncbi:hypothetical protein GQ53DRAFT_748527 [Thozetella sp. PMI_491]|nr:hypothetical protein GQ53DRAFT_748527 [Thozetella sp. PMI_491]
MAVGLIDMPVEVLQDIIRSLCPHCEGDQAQLERLEVTYPKPHGGQHWRSAIANDSPLGGLYRTSRLLRTLVMPVLHHRIVIRSWPRDELFPLTQFFCQHPDLALEVREVSILEISGTHQRPNFSGADIALIKDAFARRGYSMPELQSMRLVNQAFLFMIDFDFDKVKNDEIRQLLIDLLLSYTTSIEHLAVECVESQQLGRQILPSTPLTMLHHLEIRRTEQDEGIVWLWEHSDFLQLTPNLRSLKIDLCASVSVIASLKNIRLLDLEQGKLGYNELKALVKSCPKLESFRYSCGGFSGEEYDDHPRFSARELCWAFRPLKTTLRVLNVDLSTNQRNAPGDMMDDLTENSALELICIGNNCLYPVDFYGAQPAPASLLVDLLPKKIRSLSLGNISNNEYPMFAHFAETVLAGTFPDLQYVRYRDAVKNGSSLQLEEMFRRAGVNPRGSPPGGWGL